MSETITGINEVNDSADGYEVTTTEQVIRLEISNRQDCCESWGYFWSNDKPDDFIGAKLLGVSITDTSLNTEKMEKEGAYDRDDGGVMFVTLETDKGLLQFTAYNCHNGYYGHTARVVSKQLEVDECL